MYTLVLDKTHVLYSQYTHILLKYDKQTEMTYKFRWIR